MRSAMVRYLLSGSTAAAAPFRFVDCESVQGRVERFACAESRVKGRGSRVEGRGSRVEGRGSGV
eukprot:2284374-Rhodomonas_salina.1